MVKEGQFADAAQAYFRLSSEQSRRVLTPGHSIALADWLSRHRHLRDYPRGPLGAEAHLGAGLVQLNELGQPAAAYQHLVEVFDHDPDPDLRRVARRALSEIAER